MKKKFAVFIDRDGVINHDPGYFHKIKELVVLPNVGRAIKLLNDLKIPTLVVTNQSVVARGLITEREVEKIHEKIQGVISKDKALIDKFYYCPHHPEAKVSKYRVICSCRKPGIGMFLQAQSELGIDLENSWIIGDSFKEIEAGRRIGCNSIAVLSGSSDFRDSKPDFIKNDLFEAVKAIASKIAPQSHLTP